MTKLMEAAERLRQAIEAEDYARAQALAVQYGEILQAAVQAEVADAGARTWLIRDGVDLMVWALGMTQAARARYAKQYLDAAQSPGYENSGVCNRPHIQVEG